MHLTTFSSLLFLCDELQEWGRKTWHELYTGLSESSITLEINCFTDKLVDVTETINMNNIQNTGLIVENICRAFERQYSLYKTTFRDGQYTSMRDFDLKKTMKYKLPDEQAEKREIVVQYELLQSTGGHFIVDLSEVKDEKKRTEFREKINEKLREKMYKTDLQIR